MTVKMEWKTGIYLSVDLVPHPGEKTPTVMTGHVMSANDDLVIGKKCFSIHSVVGVYAFLVCLDIVLVIIVVDMTFKASFANQVVWQLKIVLYSILCI